ncbi:MAG TPA: hypothetical protein VM513_36785 [Kofleriaceae bacterium]|nr:hypothetical protein [Kofleriaceae bacterium]
MNDRARLALILGGIAAVVGGAVYILKVHLPNRERGIAQGEIEAWEQRLTAARTCLLGANPASSDSAEALSVRELSPDLWDKSCTSLIGKLTRSAGEATGEETGIPAVEQAWEDIDKAATRAARAFATHVDPFGEKFEDRGKPSPLPTALKELDSAHAALRAAAGMSPPRSVTGPKLPKAELIAITDGTEPVTKLDETTIASAGGAIIIGGVSAKDTMVGSRGVEVVVVPGAAPKLARVGYGSTGALPDLTWGASALETQLVVGPVTAEGAITPSVMLDTKDPVVGVYATAGKLGDGVVAYRAAANLGFARATGGGAFALTDKPVLVESVAAAGDVTGRAAVAWSDYSGALTGALLVDGTELKPLPLGSGRATSACLTKAHAWAGEMPQFVRFDATAAQPHLMNGYALYACGDDHALFQKSGLPGEYAVCTESCRQATIKGLRHAAVSGLVGDRVVAALAHRGVVGVWSEASAPAFYTFPGVNFEPAVAHSNGKVLDLVGLVDGKAAILRLPIVK